LQCFREADAAAQGIFTSELRMIKCMYSRVGSPRASIKTNGSSTTDMSSSFPPSSYSAPRLAQCFFESPPSASFKNFLDICVSPMSLSLARNRRNGACGVWNILNEVLLAPAGGLDRRRLLDSLGAAAGKEEDAAEHRAEDTHGELLRAVCQQ
jgi:hypothetical protein